MIINTDLIYPIGSIYLSVNATNPSKYFGGTWEQITSDAYLKIVTQNAGSLGGTSVDHKIPIESMPSHDHGVYGALTGENKPITNTGNDWGVNTTHGWTTNAISKTGGGQAYYPYYYGVYVWKRTA